MTKKIKLPETEEGTEVFNLDPLIIKSRYDMNYIHSLAQDSPFFAGLQKGVLLGTQCTPCRYTYATPRKKCMYCGLETEWFDLPKTGIVHTYTTCYFGGERFLKDTPYNLIMVEFSGVNTLFLSRLVGIKGDDISIGMEVTPRFVRNSKVSITDVYFVPFL